LTKFSIDLTAITQEQVDAAPTIDKALDQYLQWLESINLVDSKNGNRIGNWCFCSWGDVDIMQSLREELPHSRFHFHHALIVGSISRMILSSRDTMVGSQEAGFVPAWNLHQSVPLGKGGHTMDL
jgi:inhibitor of KinA sporulation pathway (predicted exonuclease)